jgi:hypothetical protein
LYETQHAESDLLVARQYAQSTALFHASEVLFCFSHVSIDLVHPFFNAVQLLWGQAIGNFVIMPSE